MNSYGILHFYIKTFLLSLSFQMCYKNSLYDTWNKWNLDPKTLLEKP